MRFLVSAAVLCLCRGDLRAEPTEIGAVALAARGAQFLRLNGKDELINKINTRYVLRVGDMTLEVGIYRH